MSSKQRFLERIANSENYKGISTGIKPLDDILSGGFVKQSVVGVMGVPGVGKTTICQQWAESFAKQNREVLYANFEMPEDVMIARSLSRLLKQKGVFLNPLEVLRFFERSEKQQQAISEVIDDYFDGFGKLIHYDVLTNTDIKTLESTIRDWCKKQALVDNPIIIIDYLHKLSLVDDAGRIITDNCEKISRAMDCFRKLSIDLDTTIIVISAINRSSQVSNSIDLSSARDSSNIEYGVDTMIAMQKDYDCDNTINFKVLKHRLCGLGECSVYFDGEHAVFSERGDE